MRGSQSEGFIRKIAVGKGEETCPPYFLKGGEWTPAETKGHTPAARDGVAEGKRQSWWLQRHFKDVGAENASCGGGADGEERGKPAGGLRVEEAAPASAQAPWPTLPPGPPPFHQHLFNRNIKGPGPATTPPFASI